MEKEIRMASGSTVHMVEAWLQEELQKSPYKRKIK
jgi:hypothetical protein